MNEAGDNLEASSMVTPPSEGAAALPVRYPPWGWSDLALFVALAIPCLLTGILAAKTVFYLLPSNLVGHAAGELIGQFVGYAILFALMAQILRHRYGLPFWKAIGWNVRVRGIDWAFGLGLVVAAFTIALGILLKTPKVASPMDAIMKDPRNVPVVALFATTLGPIAEEIIFRGFLLPLLARSMGKVLGVILSALPFALLHGQQYAWSWQHVMLIMVAGCAFGIAKLKTGSTAYATLVHSGYNSLFLAAFFAQKWIDAGPDF